MKKQKSIKSLFMSQRIIALSCLVFLFLFFSCFGKNFLTKNSMVSLLESVYYIICLAFGMTFVISTGGIDLSIGSVAMCGALIGGVSYNEWHMLDFIYIEDCVEAIAKISLADHNPHAEYNIGGGEVIPYTRIIDKARKLFPTAPIHVGPGDLGYDNLGALSVQRAFEDFGWKPRFSIEQGMEQYMNWLKNF